MPIALTLALALACGSPSVAQAGGVEVGQPAPDFTLTDLDGQEVTLSDHLGKTVVLEWFNPGCPFVVHAHGEGPLKDLAARHAEQGVVWLAINSGAPGKQGHGLELNREAAATWNMSHPVLLDEDGVVGRQYGAKTTPEMVVVAPDGLVAYHGALDNAPRGSVRGGGELIVYVDRALGSVAAGQPVATPKTKPYGCSVKYQ